ncbi:MAG: hypothetical protein KatS3mg105_5147 [Gemmatales bacterium]|nr:MAG: hypothetical protein KatS3mg105_5147 [Gemmatales bacterium]GIW97842.1 MAG: hypothetical protein KatS3mg111_1175 [Pirellulaceae bacterium]
MMTERLTIDERWGLLERLTTAAEILQGTDIAQHDELAVEAALEWIVVRSLADLFQYHRPEEFRELEERLDHADPNRRREWHRWALLEAMRGARVALRNCQNLDRAIDGAVIDEEAEDIAVSLLELRLELFAIENQLRSERDRMDSPADWQELFPLLQDLIGWLDEEIDRWANDLCVADDTFWITNLRSDLKADAWQPRPWWLTDEIESLRIERRVWQQTIDERLNRITGQWRVVEERFDLLPDVSVEEFQPVEGHAELALAADTGEALPETPILVLEREMPTAPWRQTTAGKLDQGTFTQRLYFETSNPDGVTEQRLDIVVEVFMPRDAFPRFSFRRR